MSNPIDTMMLAAVDEGVFPGGVLLAAEGDRVVHCESYGSAQKIPQERPMSRDTVFDIASLTKPLSIVTLIMLLKKNGKIGLGHPVSRYLPDFAESNKEQITIRHLLKHTSGLPAWKPYYQEWLKADPALLTRGSLRDKILYAIYNEATEYPAGYSRTYSDLGYIVLGAVVESIWEMPLHEIFSRYVAGPIGLENTSYFAAPRTLTPDEQIKFAATTDCPWRKKVLCGEVEDDHAWLMGGAAGHAGVFSTAQDLHRFLVHLLTAFEQGTEILPQPVIHEFLGPKTKYKLGWDAPDFEGSQSGKYFSHNTIGHLGYTGGSMWLDLEKKFHIILLTNRTHPSRGNEKIKEFRPKIHDLIVETYFKGS